MADINLLPKQLAELIAAGEVVERPASVIKELIENSIDAGANKITVEIQHGGISYMRVTDNGCGIESKQVPTAFLRHATSKIKNEEDLFKIATLGFRGEALASISAVARVEMLTKTAMGDTGTRYVINGGEEDICEKAGCPAGTTIIIRDIFFNTPARMKFLKKDVAEATAVAAVVDAAALAHPEISFRFIKDSKSMLATSGDGNLDSVIYSVLGREFASGVIQTDSTTSGIRVSGRICKPVYCRPTRSWQYIFLNNRNIRSGVVSKALDQAYKSTVMVGKFPACVLNLEIPFEKVDVNVHPAKTEVRFSDERAVFDAVYYAVKNALTQGDTRPQMELKPKTVTVPATPNKLGASSVEESKPHTENKTVQAQIAFVEDRHTVKSAYTPPVESGSTVGSAALHDFQGTLISDTSPENVQYVGSFSASAKAVPSVPQKAVGEAKVYEKILDVFSDGDDVKFENATFMDETEMDFRYIGEAFRTYIIVQHKGSIWFIDKHAAHERMLYEQLKSGDAVQVQVLLSPVSVTLSREEYRAVCDNMHLLRKVGFEVEEFGTVSVLVRAVPACLAKNNDVMFLMCNIAANLVKFGKAETEILDDLYHNIACRSAIKGGNVQSAAEMEALAKKILSDKDVMYCPHGRPVAFELTRRELEKQFGRTK